MLLDRADLLKSVKYEVPLLRIIARLPLEPLSPQMFFSKISYMEKLQLHCVKANEKFGQV